MLDMSYISRIAKREMGYKSLVFGPFPYGLNTAKPTFEIHSGELSYCLNLLALRGGRWKTRPAISKYTNSATTGNSSPKYFELCPIGSNNYELLIDANDVLYYLDSSLDPVEIKDALEGAGTIQPFAGTAMIFDTSYIKFCDLVNITGATKANPCVITYSGQDLRNGQSITINGVVGMTQLNGNSYTIAGLDSTTKTFQLSGINSGAYGVYTNGGVASMIAIAYDKGTGTSGYQFDNHTGDEDSTVKLDNTNTRISWKFTSQSWDTGYTIPPVTFTVKALKTDNVLAAGALVAVLRLVSDNSVLATKNILDQATDLTTTATEYSVTFSSDDITSEMALSTVYYMSVEYAAGTAANYAIISCSDVISGGHCYEWTGAAWGNVSTQDPIMSLRPGRPPKGSWGVVSDNHLIVYDPDNPGKPVFSAPGDFQNWSTSTLAGHVGAVDDNANNFAVGAMVDHYGDLFVFGTKAQPYLAKLTGSSPTDWKMPRMYQKVSSTHKTCLSVVNDVWYGSRDGVDGLSGVQEYGDLRTFFASDPVYDRIEDNWDEDTTIAGYYPADGQYFLYMPTHHRVLVAHTKIPTRMQMESGDAYARYPWTEYELYRDILTSSTYKWTVNGSEYYMEIAAGGDPSITTQPDFILLDGKKITEGTAGSLNDHQWGYALDPSSSYYTVYFKDSDGDPDTSGVELRSVLGPTMFSSHNNLFFIGGSDGYVHKIDTTEYKDQGSHKIRFGMRGMYLSFPFTNIHIVRQQIMVAGFAGAQLNLKVWTDDRQLTPTITTQYLLSVDDCMTVDEADMDVDDAYFLVNAANLNPLFKDINFNCRSIQVGIEDILLARYPVYIDNIMLMYKSLTR